MCPAPLLVQYFGACTYIFAFLFYQFPVCMLGCWWTWSLPPWWGRLCFMCVRYACGIPFPYQPMALLLFLFGCLFSMLTNNVPHRIMKIYGDMWDEILFINQCILWSKKQWKSIKLSRSQCWCGRSLCYLFSVCSTWLLNHVHCWFKTD